MHPICPDGAFHMLTCVLHEGTIKSCQKFLIKHNKQKLREMMDSAKDPGKVL